VSGFQLKLRPGKEPADAVPRVSAPLVPGVNLLPPTVAERQSMRRLKVSLLMGLGVVAIALAGIEGFAIVTGAAAETELADLEAQQDHLRASQAKYQEVVDITNELERTANALVASMVYEVEWVPLIDAILAVLPPDALMTNIAMQAMGPGRMAPANPNVLGSPGIGAVTFAVTVKTLPDAADWIDSLSAIPGFMDATYTSAQLQLGAGAIADPAMLEQSNYVITSSVQLNIGALSGDFLLAGAQATGETTTTAGSEAPADEPTAATDATEGGADDAGDEPPAEGEES
jgi:hypothetical protein